MSRHHKKRHPFIKFILFILFAALLCLLGVGIYLHYHPDESIESLGEKAKQAKQEVQEKAPGVKEALGEKLDEEKEKLPKARLKSTADINLRAAGDGYYYFTYNGEDYKALYSYNTWTIYDSYKITNKKDMKIICQALSDEHQVPSRDGQSYRTAEDMAYEWDQHNKIHMVAPEDSATRERTRNVDLDPEDQGKTYKDLYNENLGNN